MAAAAAAVAAMAAAAVADAISSNPISIYQRTVASYNVFQLGVLNKYESNGNTV